MELYPASISYEQDGANIEASLFTYNEEEKQDNEINAENAKLVFSPKFIPYDPSLADIGLTPNQILVYGFIDFYTHSGSGRFYFTNEQLAGMLRCGLNTVSESVRALEKNGLIKCSRKMRAGGGQIRFIGIRNSRKQLVATTEKVPTNKNKIKENKIKENKIKDTDCIIFIKKFNELFSKNYQVTKDRIDKLNNRLKRFPLSDIMVSLDNLASSDFHRGKNDRNWVADPDFLIRSDEQVDKFLNLTQKKKVLSSNLPI